MKLNIKSQVKMNKKMPSQTPIMCISQLVGPQKVAPKTPGICFYSKRNSEDYATADIEVGQSCSKSNSNSFFACSPRSKSVIKDTSDESGVEKSLAMKGMPSKIIQSKKTTRNTIVAKPISKRSRSSQKTRVDANISNIPVSRIKIDNPSTRSSIFTKDLRKKVFDRLYTERSKEQPLLKLGKYLKLKRLKNSSRKTCRVRIKSCKKKSLLNESLQYSGEKPRIQSNQRKPKENERRNMLERANLKEKRRVMIQKFWIKKQLESNEKQSIKKYR
ncbi:unnamed protein product [Moneuplotes crassus]|uniref:Uncharacterized protein n=1 Tax=Euplotes crassus TaxID=5936 RepID=A0AAD1UCP9_EUPCR|nr:unnamed protein product [Moneuplotes crassus]